MSWKIKITGMKQISNGDSWFVLDANAKNYKLLIICDVGQRNYLNKIRLNYTLF